MLVAERGESPEFRDFFPDFASGFAAEIALVSKRDCAASVARVRIRGALWRLVVIWLSGHAAAALQTLNTGDCVAVVFADGRRRLASVELALPLSIRCWGYSFTFPDYCWCDTVSGEQLRLDPVTDAERHELWRLVARSRIVQFDWEESARLSDWQLEQMLAILDHKPADRTAQMPSQYS